MREELEKWPHPISQDAQSVGMTSPYGFPRWWVLKAPSSLASIVIIFTGPIAHGLAGFDDEIDGSSIRMRRPSVRDSVPARPVVLEMNGGLPLFMGFELHN